MFIECVPKFVECAPGHERYLLNMGATWHFAEEYVSSLPPAEVEASFSVNFDLAEAKTVKIQPPLPQVVVEVVPVKIVEAVKPKRLIDEFVREVSLEEKDLPPGSKVGFVSGQKNQKSLALVRRHEIETWNDGKKVVVLSVIDETTGDARRNTITRPLHLPWLLRREEECPAVRS